MEIAEAREECFSASRPIEGILSETVGVTGGDGFLVSLSV